VTHPLTEAGSGPLLHDDLTARFSARVQAALSAARSSGGTVTVGVATELSGEIDPTALVASARRPGEQWFCLEQPDRDGFALAGLGAAHALQAHGAGRFGAVAKQWRELSAAAIIDRDLSGPLGSGLVAVGGFAFADDGGQVTEWDGFPPASMLVPELAIARHRGRAQLTLAVPVSPDDDADELLSAALGRVAELHAGRLPLFDPAPLGRYRVQSSMPPSHYEDAVARAVHRIRAGELEKIVLAREVRVHAPADHDPGAVLGLLRDAFPSCYVFAVGRGDATFLAASPELLVRREGQRASTVALAGSTRRSADPAVDDHLGERLLRSDKDREENEIVVRRIARALAPHSVWVTAAPEPVVVKVANIQHLATPIRAQLAAPMDAIQLAGVLHPTPAVGGEPWRAAAELIPALEGLDRGWYAGPVGYCDQHGDGEFCVALRCALLRGPVAQLFAGGGIVRDSDPAAELAETEVKLGALLPVLAG
jgi:salicylate biosynthesis isochorismate synthase/menaquinone-specific isochorismate synthase